MLTGAADRREEEEGRRRRYLFDLKTTGIHYCFYLLYYVLKLNLHALIAFLNLLL